MHGLCSLMCRVVAKVDFFAKYKINAKVSLILRNLVEISNFAQKFSLTLTFFNALDYKICFLTIQHL
jgi:hypothetical protein